MQIISMRDLKNTVEMERRCAEENGRTVDGEKAISDIRGKYGI